MTPTGNIIQGSEVTVKCIVDSKPEPSSIMWTNITESDPIALGCSENNINHCWLTLSNVTILDSGIYQCEADNGIRGSPVFLDKHITVYG